MPKMKVYNNGWKIIGTNANLVDVADQGNFFTGLNVEDILQDIGSNFFKKSSTTTQTFAGDIKVKNIFFDPYKYIRYTGGGFQTNYDAEITFNGGDQGYEGAPGLNGFGNINITAGTIQWREGAANQYYSLLTSKDSSFINLTSNLTWGVGNATFETVIFDTEVYKSDPRGCFQHDVNSYNWKTIIKKAGKYRVEASIAFDGYSTAGKRAIMIRVNGTNYISTNETSAANGARKLSTSMTYNFNVNDYIEIIAWQNSGDVLNIIGGQTDQVSKPRLSITKIN